MKAAYRAFYERTPQEFTAQVTVDDEGKIVTIELPGGSLVAVPIEALRTHLNNVKARENGQSGTKDNAAG